METFIGYVKTPQDALLIFEACRQGQLKRVQRRLSSKERNQIQSGSIFAWDENEAGMRRWTDGKTWSPSRVLGSFLTYRELDTKRRPRRSQLASTNITPSSSSPSPQYNKSTGHAMCSYKQDGLVKQSFSICTADNQKLHLISYYNKRDVLNGRLQQPSMDPVLGKIVIPKGVYPDLNPLDTSGGHSATLHNMRQQSYQDEDANDDDNSDYDNEISMDHQSSSTPPSLSSSSPCSSVEDINMDVLSSPVYNSLPPPSSPPHHYHPSLPTCLLPTQEIAWGKIPSSEDQRQLQAIQDLMKL